VQSSCLRGHDSAAQLVLIAPGDVLCRPLLPGLYEPVLKNFGRGRLLLRSLSVWRKTASARASITTSASRPTGRAHVPAGFDRASRLATSHEGPAPQGRSDAEESPRVDVSRSGREPGAAHLNVSPSWSGARAAVEHPTSQRRQRGEFNPADKSPGQASGPMARDPPRSSAVRWRRSAARVDWR
jgi:hypothetical protein